VIFQFEAPGEQENS